MEQQQKDRNDKAAIATTADEDSVYISQLSPFELSAYRIAKSHLGTSFHLKKSNGFLKWSKK